MSITKNCAYRHSMSYNNKNLRKKPPKKVPTACNLLPEIITHDV